MKSLIVKPEKHLIDHKKNAVAVCLLQAVPKVLRKHPDVLAIFEAGKSGRQDSTDFEERLKREVYLPLKEEIIAATNRLLEEQNFSFRLKGIDAPLNESEADKRTIADLTLIFEDENQVEHLAPINIKYTSGTTNDNVCGWIALSSVLDLGKAKKSGDLMKAIRKLNEEQQSFSSSTNDYYLFTFYKQHSGIETFLGSNLCSFLTIDPESFSFNARQSLPLQINAAKVLPIDSSIPVEVRRAQLASFLFEKISQHAEATAKATSATVSELQEILSRSTK